MTVAEPLAPAVPREDAGAAPARITAVDTLRGAVMVLMVLDTVRVFFSAEPLNRLDRMSAGLFLTRWITHSCAPVFVLLAGAGAFLHGRGKTRGELSRYLLVRGALLVCLEVTVVRLGWTFDVDYGHYVLAGVLWCLGISMIALAGLVHLPRAAILAFGLVIVAGHNLIDSHVGSLYRAARDTGWSWLVQFLYLGGPIAMGSKERMLFVFYSFVPWVGVMALGYVFGAVLAMPPERRRRWCLCLGLSAIGLFCVLRGLGLYGDPHGWDVKDRPLSFALMSLVDTTKYPASLVFLLMTLGPAIAVLPLLERRGRGPGWLAVFGRVPLFFYVLHIPLVHGFAVLLAAVRGHVDPWLFAKHPAIVPAPPEGLGYSIPVLYVFAALIVLALYLPCRWFAERKSRHAGGWWSLF